MINDADTNLKLARRQIRERRRIESLLEQTREKIEEAREQLREPAPEAGEEDTGDSQFSLQSVFREFFGDKAKIRETENREKARARLLAEAAKEKLKELQRLEMHYQETLKRYRNADTNYEQALEEKIQQSGKSRNDKEMVLEERIAGLKREEKELSQAIEAVAPAEDQLARLQQVLENIAGHSVLTIWGSREGSVPQELERARRLAGNAHKYLEVFNIELATVDKNFRTEADVNITCQQKFLEMFFEALFEDILDERQIAKSLKHVQETRNTLVNMEKALRQEYAAAENELKEAEQERAGFSD